MARLRHLCGMLKAVAAQKKRELSKAQSSARVQKEKPLYQKTMTFAHQRAGQGNSVSLRVIKLRLRSISTIELLLTELRF